MTVVAFVIAVNAGVAIYHSFIDLRFVARKKNHS